MKAITSAMIANHRLRGFDIGRSIDTFNLNSGLTIELGCRRFSSEQYLYSDTNQRLAARIPAPKADRWRRCWAAYVCFALVTFHKSNNKTYKVPTSRSRECVYAWMSGAVACNMTCGGRWIGSLITAS